MTTRCRAPLYAVLDVDRDADAEAIRDAYRATVKEYHPDVFEHEHAQDLFVWATRAKAVLTAAGERQRYDRVGHARFCEQEGWTGPSCSASRAAAVYWPGEARSTANDSAGTARERGTDSGASATASSATAEGASAASTTGSASATNANDSPGTTAPGGAAESNTTATHTTAGSSRRGTTTASTRGTAHTTGERAGSAGFATATQRGRSTTGGGGAAWSREGFTTQEGMGSKHRAEELYFRNIAQVDTDGSGDAGLGSGLAPFVGVGFSIVVLFGSFALILYAL